MWVGWVGCVKSRWRLGCLLCAFLFVLTVSTVIYFSHAREGGGGSRGQAFRDGPPRPERENVLFVVFYFLRALLAAVT